MLIHEKQSKKRIFPFFIITLYFHFRPMAIRLKEVSEDNERTFVLFVLCALLPVYYLIVNMKTQNVDQSKNLIRNILRQHHYIFYMPFCNIYIAIFFFYNYHKQQVMYCEKIMVVKILIQHTLFFLKYTIDQILVHSISASQKYDSHNHEFQYGL